MARKTQQQNHTDSNSRRDELLTELAGQCESPEQFLSLLNDMKKSLIEKALQAELDQHLGYAKHDRSGRGSGNSRNGSSSKIIQGEFGQTEIRTPRDRNGTFEPQLVSKHQRRMPGFDQKILALYAKGMTTRDIADTMRELYEVEVSHELISQVTEAIVEDVIAWQNRPLSEVYPILFLDGLVVPIRSEGRIEKHTIYLALAINMEGKKELLGLWIAKTEGAKFWLNVLNDLHSRGVQDVLIACVDGLTGFPEAIQSVFPQTDVQLCIVHLVRNSLKFVSFKERKAVARDLKAIYRAPTLSAAEQALREFAERWDAKHPMISKSWQRHWSHIAPMFAYPPVIRQVIYTTNAIESVNSVIRKAIRNRKIFPNEQSALKIVYLAIQEASKRWTMPIRHWGQALGQFAILYEDRLPVNFLEDRT